MSCTDKILPGTGRGTMRSMVEGASVAFPPPVEALPAFAPSTAFGGPPPAARVRNTPTPC